jgi:hypothetical protein
MVIIGSWSLCLYLRRGIVRRQYWILHIYAKLAINAFQILTDKENIKEWIKRNYESGAVDAQLEQILHYHDADEFITEDFEFTYNLTDCSDDALELSLCFPEETYHPFAVIHFDPNEICTTHEWIKTNCFYF